MTEGSETKRLMAACGLLCGPCPLRRMPFDDDAAGECVAWFQAEGWLAADEGVAEALERKMYCTGCLGDREVHWSVSEENMCWILECSVDGKRLRHCNECDDFPCERLVDWSKGNERYAEALARLTAEVGEKRRST